LDLGLYKSLVKPAMFLTTPETAHGMAKWAFKRTMLWRLSRRRLCVEDKRLEVRTGQINLKNPIGLAAGFDKNCEMSRTLFLIGFGYATLGTVTLNPREGNPKPRIWRYPNNSLVNSMGLPNDGAQQIAANLAKHAASRTGPIVVSVSGLGVEEFAECYRQIEPLADGVELNISTPNTIGVRIFQQPPILNSLLTEIHKARKSSKPIWVKIPPYFNNQQRDNVLDLVEVCVRNSVDGITAINTKLVQEPRASIGTGGLSGPLIFEDMIRIVGDVYNQTEGKIPINACGGISSGIQAWRAFEMGASTVQIYTALIYEGPGIVAKLNRELLQLLRTSKVNSLNQVTGTGLH
jgi:dihydroorotate dehydrogenase